VIPYNPRIKRLADFILSATALLLLSPLLLIIALLIFVDSKGSPFFIQERIGKGMIPFRLIKFRSMTHQFGRLRDSFEPGETSRLTKIGKLLRKTKLDELPELLNVLQGDMSIVGPRPEVNKYVRLYREDYEEILRVRPGLSDFASIKYRNEEEILAARSNPEDYYVHEILPDKLQLAKQYVRKISFGTDCWVIRKTLSSLLTSMFPVSRN
jgi:lipopolysaccharide/colanic/teichoic acid biosynthesis glycosyltransferase